MAAEPSRGHDGTSASNGALFSRTLDAGSIARFLFQVIFGLLLIHSILQIIHYVGTPVPWQLRDLFDLDEEAAFPTWYSTLGLLAAATLVFVIAARRHARRDRWSRYWLGLAFGFLALSLDEVVGLHETLNTETEFSWTLPAAAGVLVVFAVYVPFIRALPSPLRRRVLIAGAVFLGGALVVEYATDPLAENAGLDSLAYNLSTVPEEGLEMVGVVIFIHALIDHLGDGGPLALSLGKRS